MQRIRIMHVVDNLGRGGMQKGLVSLIERLDPHRFEHVVCTMRYLNHALEHRLPGDRARTVCLADKDRPSRFQLPAIALAVGEWKPDLVHSRNWAAIEAVLAGRLTGCRAVIHSEHGLDENPTEPRRRTWFRRLSFELAHRVLCVSHQLKNFHATRTGFPANRISVIHNGVDKSRFCPDPGVRARMRQELGLSPDEFCIGSVGNLTPVKDYMTLLEGVRQFAGGCRNWRLVVAGEGSELVRMRAFCDAHSELAGRVIFFGLTDRVAELLPAFDTYVLTSLTEGICNSLLEAMAVGLPVVVTDTGGNPEVVDGESGLVFPVGDCRRLAEHLTELYTRPDRRKHFAHRALQRARDEFSLESMVDNYSRLYSSLAGGSTTPAGHGRRSMRSELSKGERV